MSWLTRKLLLLYLPPRMLTDISPRFSLCSVNKYTSLIFAATADAIVDAVQYATESPLQPSVSSFTSLIDLYGCSSLKTVA